MNQEEEEQGPSIPRPWYYRSEYMLPMLVFWPSGAILVLRSPWNNNTMLGGLAWAVMIIGAVMALRWIQAGSYQPLATFYVPGILLTLVTQVQWAAYRKLMETDDPGAESELAELDDDESQDRPPRPSARRRRKNPRTGRSKG
ncbi:MAG: hypothetical protein O2913_00145 [Chloroflexi bacterium]|nr:hypothetical protein [Chloroflexota bacterium]